MVRDHRSDNEKLCSDNEKRDGNKEMCVGNKERYVETMKGVLETMNGVLETMNGGLETINGVVDRTKGVVETMKSCVLIIKSGAPIRIVGWDSSVRMCNGNGVDGGRVSSVGINTYTKLAEFVYQKFNLFLKNKNGLGILYSRFLLICVSA